MKKTRKKAPASRQKAYQIGEGYFVSAFNEPQAIGTLMAHLGVSDAKYVGACVEVNPAKVVVHFEQNDGRYLKGSLAELMPTSDAPEVLIDPDYS
jgi:hypothetical protein